MPPTQRHPLVRYEPQLIDATMALLLNLDWATPWSSLPSTATATWFPIMVLQMFGSIAGSESPGVGL